MTAPDPPRAGDVDEARAEIDAWRAKVCDLTTRGQIDRWLADALHVGIDPL